jgi:hypothetical protein
MVFFVAVGAGCLYLTFHSDQRDLTEQETATVTDQWTSPKTKSGNDEFIEYRYEYAGVTYAGRTYIYTSSPPDVGDTEIICVDPEDPRRHALLLDLAADCGDKDLGGKTEKARVAP